MGGKTFINPARKQKKQTRKPSTSTPGQKLRLSTESRIEEWTQGMVHTAATQSVLDLILQGKTWITVTGSPGEGKTTAAYLTLKKLYSMGRQVFEIRTPDDYFKVKDSKSPVLLFNDIYGSNQFSIDSLGKWEPVLADILDMKEHRQLKSLSSGQRDSKLSSQKRSLCVILVSRSIVLHSATCHLGRFKNLIQESVVNLTTDIKVSAQERLDMWKYHADMYNVSIDEKTVIDVCRMPLSHGFPHCCRLFASMYSENKSLSMNSFFSKPIEFLHQTIESLLADSTTGKLLREMLRHDGCLELDSITDDERRYNFKKVSEKLEGTYLSKEKGSVTFHHPSVYASVAFVVCKTDSLFVIRFCSLSFLNERVRFLGLESGEKDTLVTLFIDSKYIDDYIQRLNNELIDDNISLVLSHASFHDKSFVEKFTKAVRSCYQVASDKDFIPTLIHRIDKQTKQSFLFHCTNNKSDRLLKYICNHVQLSQQEQTDALFGICEHSTVSSLMFLFSQHKNVSLNETQFKGLTSLLVASSKSSSEILKLLIEKGADVTANDRGGNSVLYLVCKNGVDDDGDIVRMLIDNGADVNWKCKNYLNVAAGHGHVNVVTALTDKGADVNKADGEGRNALHFACLRGYSIMLGILCDKGVDINQTDNDGGTALHCACVGGHVDVMTALIDRGVDINHTDNDGGTALHCACVGGHVDVMTALLDRGVDINQTTKNGVSAFHCACTGGHVDFMTALLDRGVDINQTDKNGVTAFHCACAEGHVDVMTALLDRGVDINQTDKNGVTALLYACIGGHIDVMTALLDRGVDINQTGENGVTAFHCACTGGHVDVMTALLDMGVDVNQIDENGVAAFHYACAGGHVDVMTALLDRGVDINHTDNDGGTALHCACAEGHVDVITTLLDRGVDINQTTKNGVTAFHCACAGGHVDVMTELLDRGFDIK